MRLAPIQIAALVTVPLLGACANTSSPAPSPASASAPAGAPALPAAAPCDPGAYRHEGPDFCVQLPASARGVVPTAIENGEMFPGVVITWAPTSDTARIAEWKRPERPAQHNGTFEVWKTEPVPGGSYFLIHDATQHDTHATLKVPSVRGMVVVVGEAVAVRCVVTVNLERESDARRVAASRAADLDACKSLRLFGRS